MNPDRIRKINLFKLLSDFPMEEAIDLIEAAVEADPGSDVDELIDEAAIWLDSVADFSKLDGPAQALEAFDHVIFAAALRLLWKTQSPEAKARRMERRKTRRDRREARRSNRTNR